jgi:osmotically-inducible protein OsmY
MKTLRPCLTLLAVAIAAGLSGCSTTPTQAADIGSTVRTALDQAGFKDVTAAQDRDKGVVTLSGHVAADDEKLRAESVVKSIAGQQVVSNQIAVLPPGAEGDAKKVNSALDKGIESNLDAALIRENLQHDVKYAVKNHVVTLTGDVDSQATRRRAADAATAVPNVQQVVNELQIKAQKATSSR